MLKVLIVDDSMIIRGAIESWLGDLELEIVGQASNGVAAVEMVKRTRPDIVTLDITMPEMDGLTAIGHMLAIAPRTTIIVISALAGKDTALAAMKKGAASFLLKPFTRAELHEVFQEVMEAM
jgi:two-component system chemotaxis response regulator CheY